MKQGIVACFFPFKHYGHVLGDDRETYFLSESDLKKAGLTIGEVLGRRIAFDVEPAEPHARAIPISDAEQSSRILAAAAQTGNVYRFTRPVRRTPKPWAGSGAGNGAA